MAHGVHDIPSRITSFSNIIVDVVKVFKKLSDITTLLQ